MDLKLVIVEFIALLLITLYTPQSIGKIYNEISTKASYDSYQAKAQHMNDQPNHLFYFVQVIDSQ